MAKVASEGGYPSLSLFQSGRFVILITFFHKVCFVFVQCVLFLFCNERYQRVTPYLYFCTEYFPWYTEIIRKSSYEGVRKRVAKKLRSSKN